MSRYIISGTLGQGRSAAGPSLPYPGDFSPYPKILGRFFFFAKYCRLMGQPVSASPAPVLQALGYRAQDVLYGFGDQTHILKLAGQKFCPVSPVTRPFQQFVKPVVKKLELLPLSGAIPVNGQILRKKMK